MEAQTKQETPLKRSIRSFESKNMSDFKPNRTFYQTTNIKQKRFGKLVRGEASPLLSEMQSLANYFGVPVTDFLNTQN
jgi:hypothetical protein